MNKFNVLIAFLGSIYVYLQIIFLYLVFLDDLRRGLGSSIGSRDSNSYIAKSIFSENSEVSIGLWYLLIPSFIFAYLLTYLNWKYQLTIYFLIGLLTAYLVLT